MAQTDFKQKTTRYSYDLIDRVTQILDPANSATTIAHSDSGGHTIGFDYDVRDQLRRVSDGATEMASFDYDVERRRITKTTGGVPQMYVYDGDRVVNEYGASSQLVNRYDYGVDLVRGEIGGEGERFYFSDALGSVTGLAQGNGGLATRYEYDAWGERITAQASLNRIGYTGQYRDEETGLMALGNGERYYSPGLGQFIQQDSLGGMLQEPQMLNRHSYVMNNPLSYVDPSGHEGESWLEKTADILKRAVIKERRPGEPIGGPVGGPPYGLRLEGAAVGMALNAGRQYLAEKEGSQQGWDWNQFEEAANQGAYYGELFGLLEMSGVGAPIMIGLELYFAYEGVRSGIREIGAGHRLTGIYDIVTGLVPIGLRAARGGARGRASAGLEREGVIEPRTRQVQLNERPGLGEGRPTGFVGFGEGPALDLAIDDARVAAAKPLGRFNSAGERIGPGGEAGLGVRMPRGEQLEYLPGAGQESGIRSLGEGEGRSYDVSLNAHELAPKEGAFRDPRITAETSPYIIRYDPRFPTRPDPMWSIDTAGFAEGAPTARGGIRNAAEFWKGWLDMRPETISKSNRYLIEELQRNPRGPSPRIDPTWVEHFPEHTQFLELPYKQRTLIHHHVEQGPIAIPVPAPTHVGSGGPWHRF